MNSNLKITRIDPNDSKSVAAADAEKKLFAHYGLSVVLSLLPIWALEA